VDAKQRDITCFLYFYEKLYGHDDRRKRFKLVPEAFLKTLARGHVPRPSKRAEAMPQRLSQSTIARTSTTVRYFSRWIREQAAALPHLMLPNPGHHLLE
jgi:hypothetical protein